MVSWIPVPSETELLSSASLDLSISFPSVSIGYWFFSRANNPQNLFLKKSLTAVNLNIF